MSVLKRLCMKSSSMMRSWLLLQVTVTFARNGHADTACKLTVHNFYCSLAGMAGTGAIQGASRQALCRA